MSTLYDIKCMTEDAGRPHHRVLAVARTATGETKVEWEFRDGCWKGVIGDGGPGSLIRLVCPRHGEGRLPVDEVRPQEAGRRRRVLHVICR